MKLTLVSALAGFLLVHSISAYTRRRPNAVENFAISDSALSQELTQLAQNDVNAAQDGDVVVNFQNEASRKKFDHDNAPDPFFTSVSSQLLAKPTYAALVNLQNTYNPPTSNNINDLPSEQDRADAATDFINAINQTTLVQQAFTFVAQNGVQVSPDIIKSLWFTAGSSGVTGFQTVFAGAVRGGDVVGLNNWIRFYSLEQAQQINYHGWYERIESTYVSAQFAWNDAKGWESNFLIGTSPEFDFTAFTLCAIASSSSDAKKTCSFLLGGHNVYLHVTTESDNGATVITSAYPSLKDTEEPTHPSSEPQQPSSQPQASGSPGGDDSAFQALVDQLWAADEDRAQPGDIVLNWGGHLSPREVKDVSPDPLFKSVNEALFERPVYKELMKVYTNNLFHAPVCIDETMTAFKTAILNGVLDVFANTTVFQKAYAYLVGQGKADADWDTFRPTLFTLWYGTYSRCREEGSVGSSGFEHVYMGEDKPLHGKEKEVDGQHNWMRFYLLEKAGSINYHGYMTHDKDLIGTFQYTWTTNGSSGSPDECLKKEGGFFISTSPAFDFAVLTTCALVKGDGPNCKFTLDGFPMTVTTYTQNCAASGTCIATAYPSDHA
jgi:poly(U)-specific endoribonuclease